MKTKYLLPLVIFLGSLSVQAQEKTINKNFDGISTIKLSTSSGDCDVIRSSSSNVEVEVTYSYDDDIYSAEMEKDGGTLNLQDKFAKHSSNNHGKSHWRLKVPANIALQFNSGSGDLKGSNLEIELSTNVGSGDLTLDRIKGKVKSNSGSGDISLESVIGNVSINTGSGNVDCTEGEGVIKINLGSGNADITKSAGKFAINTGSGDIDAEAVTITESSSFNSGSGDAEIKLGAELRNNISIASGSGDARLDFNGTTIQGEVTMKANKRNGEISAPFKFDSETEENSGNNTVLVKRAKLGRSDIQIKVATGSGRAVIEQ